jgi:hypothetical protein
MFCLMMTMMICAIQLSQVIDLNDNAPVFDPMSFSDRVSENVTVGSSVLTVTATDQDSGEYPCLQTGGEGLYFSSLEWAEA